MYTNTTGYQNAAFGFRAMYNNTIGTTNTAIGYEVLKANLWGSYNCGVGHQSLLNNTTGLFNSALGVGSLSSNIDGDFNTSIGAYSGSFISTGNHNTTLGYNAGAGFPSNINNATAIGTNAGFATTLTNHINVGNGSVTAIAGQVNFSVYSDGRIKDNVQENIPGLSFITQLRPVSYNLNIIKQDAIANEVSQALKAKDSNGNPLHKPLDRNNPKYPEEFEIEGIRQTGFIAQEVYEAAKKIGFDFNGVNAPKNGKGLYSLSYASFVIPLVQAVKEQQEIIEDQNTKIDSLQQRLLMIENLLNKH
jgi:trimeric autotransporter adhesin